MEFDKFSRMRSLNENYGRNIAGKMDLYANANIMVAESCVSV